MGTPAQATGSVAFESPEALSLASKQIDDWIEQTKNGFHNDSPYKGDYEIELNPRQENQNFFEFQAYSGRDINLQWQMQMFCHFCQTLPGVVEFEATITIEADQIYWSK